tara:strand:- start:38127 stop:38345 length:219 start_codon:yes stop_codon:yes gene_type:complete
MDSKLKDLLWTAALLVHSRDQDVTLENGEFATMEVDLIIGLESDLVKFFDLGSDSIGDNEIRAIRSKLLESK